MHVRRTTIAALSMAVTVIAPACSDGSDASGGTSTTEATTSASTTTSTTTTTTTTTSVPLPFDEAIVAFDERLESAGDDFCAIATAGSILSTDATTPEQVEEFFTAFASLLKAGADHLPEDSEVDGSLLEDAAEQMLADAEAGGFDPAQLDEGLPPALAAPDVAAELERLTAEIEERCD